MNIEVVLTESEICDEFAESLEARDLPEKFFYWPSPLAWRALSRDAHFAGLNRAWKAAAERVAARGNKSVISLGAGDGLRDLMLIEALRGAGVEVSYFPVDSCQTLLEAACGAAEDIDIPVTGIKADISSPPHLVYASDAATGPKMLVMAGCTLGGLDALVEIEYVAQAMAPGDLLLVDAELAAPDTLARRNTPALREFALAPMAAAGFSAADGELRFEQKRDERREGVYMVTRHFHTRRDLRGGYCGREVLIQKGERIALNFQYVFEPEAFRWLIEECGGLKLREQAVEGRFVTAVCEK
ncbi:MAG: L-histidine N(alpha)-methyltransferase [Bryobacteraceae bacterium]